MRHDDRYRPVHGAGPCAEEQGPQQPRRGVRRAVPSLRRQRPLSGMARAERRPGLLQLPPVRHQRRRHPVAHGRGRHDLPAGGAGRRQGMGEAPGEKCASGAAEARKGSGAARCTGNTGTGAQRRPVARGSRTFYRIPASGALDADEGPAVPGGARAG